MTEFEEEVRHRCTQNIEVMHALYQALSFMRRMKFPGCSDREIRRCALAILGNQKTLDLLAVGASEDELRESLREACRLTAEA